MPDVTVTPTLTISATAPASPVAGDLWWNSAIGVFFVYYDDGSSTQWVTTQPVKYINIAELKAPAGGDLTGYYPDPVIIDEVALEFPVLQNPLDLSDYTQRLASTKWVTDKFAESGVLGQVTEGPGILLTPNPLAGDSTIALKAITPDPSGTFGSAASTPVIQVDVYGRIIVSGSVAIPPVNSPTFTGIPAAPTPGPATNTTQIATTEFVQTVLGIALGPYAPLNSPVFTGTPTAPTAGTPPTTPATQIANTTWVQTYFLALTGGTVNGNVSVIRTTAQTDLSVGADAGFNAGLNFQTGSSLRWIWRKNSTAEGGSNAGSDLELISRTDAGAALFTVLTGKRSTGYIGLGVSAVSIVARLTVVGTGQTTPAIDTATSAGLGSTVYVRDSGNVVGNGGMIMFGASQGAFAAIKGFITNGSNNTLGFLDVSTRVAAADATLTHLFRFGIGQVVINPSTAIPAGGTAGAGLMFSSTANFGVMVGSGAPNKAAARGSLYLRSDGPPSYNVDGATQWAPIGGAVTASDTAPVSPIDGELWWNSVLGTMFFRYNDGNTTQWVPASRELGGQALISANDTIVYMAATTTIGVGTVDLCNTGAIGAAGETWELEGTAMIENSAAAATIAGVGIWNGSAYVAGGGGVAGFTTIGWGVTSTCKAKVTLTAPTTFTLRGTGNNAGARAQTNGQGGLANRATWISARRVS